MFLTLFLFWLACIFFWIELLPTFVLIEIVQVGEQQKKNQVKMKYQRDDWNYKHIQQYFSMKMSIVLRKNSMRKIPIKKMGAHVNEIIGLSQCEIFSMLNTITTATTKKNSIEKRFACKRHSLLYSIEKIYETPSRKFSASAIYYVLFSVVIVVADGEKKMVENFAPLRWKFAFSITWERHSTIFTWFRFLNTQLAHRTHLHNLHSSNFILAIFYFIYKYRWTATINNHVSLFTFNMTKCYFNP